MQVATCVVIQPSMQDVAGHSVITPFPDMRAGQKKVKYLPESHVADLRFKLSIPTPERTPVTATVKALPHSSRGTSDSARMQYHPAYGKTCLLSEATFS